ncbi:MAG: flagellar basal body-associated FliL family protein [Lachnospiraceae bacterium]|nr:flagellar basal body-associated FliL family protein [Lachnospiraceae bacterium]
MKKNLLSLVILSLLIVNIVLNVVVLLSVTGTNKKTAAIVTDICGILDIELDRGGNGPTTGVSMADTENYSIPDQMTITLKREAGDTKDTYFIVNVELLLNKNHEDYATYGTAEQMAASVGLIKSEIISTISQYTAAEIRNGQDMICDEILKRIQDMYGSDFIYKVAFSNFMFG